MEGIIDISLSLQSDMPIWPGDRDFKLITAKSIEQGNSSNLTQLECSVHTGTHIDAPHHFIQGGDTVECLSLETLIGPAEVVHLSVEARITARDLDALELKPKTKRLLLHTHNSELWSTGVKEFRENYVALAPDAAQWVVDHGILLIGIDYLSIQLYHDGPETHNILLGAGVVVIEGLDLSRVPPGHYELICLPLKLVGVEGAPARAVLRRIPNEHHASNSGDVS